MLAIAAYAGIIAYLELEHWKLGNNNYIKNINIMHNMLGFVISLLLVFRTNTAYDRWWEGRKLWGSLVNNSRNLAIKMAAFTHDEKERSFFKKMISAYAVALSNHLQNEKTRLELFEDAEVKIDESKHIPNQIASVMMQRVNGMYRSEKITGNQLIVLNNELQSFTDICGACERIKNTPIPYSYSAFIKKFIFVYIMTLPIGYTFSLGYYMIPVVVFIFYVLASLELIAEEIEDPFGGDTNDLPMNRLSATIKKNTEEILM